VFISLNAIDEFAFVIETRYIFFEVGIAIFKYYLQELCA
jgi:hypothetical protein